MAWTSRCQRSVQTVKYHVKHDKTKTNKNIVKIKYLSKCIKYKFEKIK